MPKLKALLKASTVVAFLILSSSTSAFADIEPAATAATQGTSGTDEGLGLKASDEIQNLDQSFSGDTQQLTELLTDKIRSSQAMHAGDEEVSEPVVDEN